MRFLSVLSLSIDTACILYCISLSFIFHVLFFLILSCQVKMLLLSLQPNTRGAVHSELKQSSSRTWCYIKKEKNPDPHLFLFLFDNRLFAFACLMSPAMDSNSGAALNK